MLRDLVRILANIRRTGSKDNMPRPDRATGSAACDDATDKPLPPTTRKSQQHDVSRAPEPSANSLSSDLDRIAELIGFVRDKEASEYTTGPFMDWTPKEHTGARRQRSAREKALKDVIKDVLIDADRSGLTLSEIHDTIVLERLYTIRGGADVSYQQVYVTVRNNDRLFEMVPDTRPIVVRLKKTPG